MPRTRLLKPEFFLDEELASLVPIERLLFAGLWLLADRDGILEHRPARIKAQLFPYENIDMKSMLENLGFHGFISIYVVSEKTYIQIDNFKKHQKPHPKEAPSAFPDKSKGEPCNYTASSGNSGTSRVKSPCSCSNSCTCPLPPAKMPGVGLDDFTETKTETAPGANDKRTAKAKAARAARGVPASFEAFWSVYPRRVNLGDAEKAWKSIRPDGELQSQMFEAIRRQSQSQDWTKENGKYIPYPASWLRAKAWTNDTGPRRDLAREQSDAIIAASAAEQDAHDKLIESEQVFGDQAQS